MAKKLAFILELENGAKLVSQISDIELKYKALGKQIRGTEKEIEAFNNATDEQKQALESEGVTLEKLETRYKVLKAEQIDLSATKKRVNADIRDQIKLFDEQGKRVPEDSLIGLRRRYRELRKEIDSLSKEARQLPENLDKVKEANGVKEQINEMGAAVGDFREQVGSYEKAITTVFEKFGIGKGKGGGLTALIEPISGLLSGGFPFGSGGVLEGLGGVGTEGASGGGGGALGGLLGDVGGLTSALGPAGLLATAGAATLVATAGYVAVEFDEILKAANATSKAFNTDIGDTIELIRQGIASGADFNGEYLDSLREYPRLVAEAGLSQEQFNEILIRSTQEGIYSDKGIDLVKEGNIRLREQTKATKTALTNAFGKEAAAEILEGVNTGAKSTFEAMQEVSKQLTEVDLTAEQTGAVLADVFGGPGEDAGIEFIKTLQDVDGNLENVINTTDAYTKVQNAQYEATLQLTTAQSNLASQFAGSGTSLRTLGTQLQAFGTEVLDKTLLKIRAVGNEFSEGGFVAGLKQLGSTVAGTVTPLGLVQGETVGEARLRQQDADALRQQTEKEEEQARLREERNKRGANGIQGLREEQTKLTQAIQDAKAKGEPYEQFLEDYNNVTKRLAAATENLNGGISRTKTVTEGQVGSLKALQAELSKIQEKLEKQANPEQGLIDQRDDLTERVRIQQEKIAAESKKSKEKQAKEALEIERLNLELEARLSIDNEKILQAELARIKVGSEVAVLEQRLGTAREGSNEFLKIEAELAQKRLDLKSANQGVTDVNTEVNLDDAVGTANSIARRLSESEEELNLRLQGIQLLAANKRIEKRLESEKLLATERFELEQQLAENVKQLDLNEVNFQAERQAERIDQRLEQQLIGLASEVENLKEYEEQKSVLILEADLERLESEKNRRLEANEELLTIESEIAEKRLELQDKLNEDIVAKEKKRLEEQEKLQKQLVGVQVGALGEIGEALGAFFLDAEATQEDFVKSLLLTLLDSVEKSINLYLAQIIAKEIASKSFGGIATAAILSGVVKGAFGVAKAQIQANEEGALLLPSHSRGTITRDVLNIRSHTPDDLKRGTIFQGYSHASKGEHFRVGNQINEAEYGEAIINKKSTQRFKPLLSAINSYSGWGKAFSDGAVLGTETGNVVTVGGTTGISAAVIPESQMTKFAEIVSTTQAESLTPLIISIVEQVITGLDESNRLKERKAEAEQNGSI